MRLCSAVLVGLSALSCVVAGVPVPRYPSPIELALSRDGARLYVVCQGTDEVVVFNLATRSIVRRIRVGRQPKSIALSADSRRIYIANSWSDTVSEIDAAALRVVRTLPAGVGADLRGAGPRGTVPVRREPHQRGYLGRGPGERRGGQAAGGGARRQLSRRLRPMADGSTARTSIRTR